MHGLFGGQQGVEALCSRNANVDSCRRIGFEPNGYESCSSTKHDGCFMGMFHCWSSTGAAEFGFLKILPFHINSMPEAALRGYGVFTPSRDLLEPRNRFPGRMDAAYFSLRVGKVFRGFMGSRRAVIQFQPKLFDADGKFTQFRGSGRFHQISIGAQLICAFDIRHQFG